MNRVASELQAIVVGAVAWIADRRRTVLAVLGATAAITIFLMPRDAAVLGVIRQPGETWRVVAATISEIGRFEYSTLMLAMLLAAIGMLRDSRRLRSMAVACLVAGLLAGITVNILRPTFGRARPHAEVEPGLYWFEINDSLNSLPSGHAMSNAASVGALVPFAPVLAVPATVYVGAVAWSRMQLNRHYPTDVLWGSVLGATVGLAVGASVRDRRRSSRSTASERS